jgi:hypothetical protein
LLSAPAGRAHSKLGGVDDSFGKGLRGFLGQVVPDTARDSPMFVWAREFLRVGTGVRVRGTIRIAFERNGGHGTPNELPRQTNKWQLSVKSGDLSELRRPTKPRALKMVGRALSRLRGIHPSKELARQASSSFAIAPPKYHHQNTCARVEFQANAHG